MSMVGRSELQLRPGQYLGEISALCFLYLPSHLSSRPLLLAGTGSEILVYDIVSRKVCGSFQVFQGIRVHGISLDYDHKESADGSVTFRIAVFGEKRVKLFSLRFGYDNVEQQYLNMKLVLCHSLPRFGNWILDICFLKDGAISSNDTCYLAIGCADNSVYLWNILTVNMFSQIKCSERCLLYSMRMMGNEIESLLVASGTIFNEIIVWRLVYQNHDTIQGNRTEDHSEINDNLSFSGLKYEDFIIDRLIGHEGSIFRIAWLANGLKLVSVSDDRSARIWEVQTGKMPSNGNHVRSEDGQLKGSVLYGHDARIWDCCVFDSLIITAGEDCTCRVWDHDGRELDVIKEHTGRGVWRCLCDPTSSVLVTAGFDSSIKVHHLYKFREGFEGTISLENPLHGKEVITISIPNSLGHGILMDSKSEYVRCLRFSRENSIYVATNSGYLYHACLLNNETVKWTVLVHVSKETPIICMDLLSVYSNHSGGMEDWVAVGDGKGSITVVVVVGSVWSPRVELVVTWSAEKERHLLGTYWCKSPKKRFIFTTDPGGGLRLWSLYQNMPSLLNGKKSYNACLIAEFISCIGMRIVCLDVSFDEEVLVCGDIRGNLLLFPLPGMLLIGKSIDVEIKTTPIIYFKGAHGVSSVCSVFLAGLCSSQVKICSTGQDGCICYWLHDKNLQTLKFLGMKQVKELSAVLAVFPTASQFENSAFGKYAVGFASANFIIWNLTTETKVVQETCGGWRRPHSYYLGSVPEMMNCFAYVKNDIIYIHKHWAPENCCKIHSRNLHIQFHGREIHSLCIISGNSLCNENQDLVFMSGWIATGCEDGTVRLTWYDPSEKTWSISKDLGQHVGGSAVRSIKAVSKSYTFMPNYIDMSNLVCGKTEAIQNGDNPVILLSVGAKRVMTAWRQEIKMSQNTIDSQCDKSNNNLEINYDDSFTSRYPLLSFQWLSTDMPPKHTAHVNRRNTSADLEKAEYSSTMTSDASSNISPSPEFQKIYLNSENNSQNDWRYMDVSAFLVKDVKSKLSVCFVIVSCSDATVSLRALVMPSQQWFDVALLSPLSVPVLALQHVIIPMPLSSTGTLQLGSLYIAICGSTDGSISFWDLTGCIEMFMQRISGLHWENYMEKRPLTGRGSQGGRQWRSFDKYSNVNKISGCASFGHDERKKNSTGPVSVGPIKPEIKMTNRLSQICGSLSGQVNSMVFPLVTEEKRNDESIPGPSTLFVAHVLKNVHQSGVNCLHVSDIKDLKLSESRFSFYVISGGDDQAVNCVRCDFYINCKKQNSDLTVARIDCATSSACPDKSYNHCHFQSHVMKVVQLDKSISAHSSAVKGVWTDGSWAFSTGVDQRVRCWKIDYDRLMESANLIISVPEPEAMDVYACGRNYYQIIVAGRGMQMVEFCVGTGD